MIDHEVENTLREIRGRVIAESGRASAFARDSSHVTDSSATAAEVLMLGTPDAAHAGTSVRALARLRANLATTERTWSRLPPILSYRRGFAARIELWLKQQIKRASHWFTWEQVNFNSAAHNALTDARDALDAHEQMLAARESSLAANELAIATHGQAIATHEAMLAELRAMLRQQKAEFDSNAARVSELRSKLSSAEERFEGALARLATGVERNAAEQRAVIEQLRSEQLAVDAVRREQIQTRATELQSEIRERVERALEEQRVCFKQLSLEAAEVAVLQDRTRRQIEARIEALETNDKKLSGD